MRRAVRLGSLGLVAALLATPALATNYATLILSEAVDGPADATWIAIGDYCAISIWLPVDCSLTGDGDLGSVRTLYGGSVQEMMVGTGPRSYTYEQIVGSLAAADYHGSLAVAAVDDTHSRIDYTLLWDEDALPAGTDPAAFFDSLNATFQGALDTMKALVENPSPTAPLPATP